MNSPRGSARTPALPNRNGSISPQLLDPPKSIHTFSSARAGSLVPQTGHKCHEGVVASSLSRFPEKVIQRILWSVDANTFASLCILNRRWRQECQKVELYAHHLSRCPSYALSNNIISGPFRKNDLSRIKAKFAAEARRNLFDAYLRPRRTFVNLISLNANSAAAFPAGEAFRFEFSPNGRTILALSSSRIYVLDATADPLIVRRQLKTLRRPLSASITDDGSLLAVLSSKHQVNVYGLTPQGVQHLQVIVLDNPPKIIAIAHEGTVLAASYEAGIEVFSLAANCLTTDRRSVRSEAVDSLNFSGDGSMLVGSSLSLEDPNAVVISAPFYTENDPDLSPREIHSRIWTTQILFPQISSVCSHVALLQGHAEGDACWLFAFDHSLMSYRAVRTDDTRAGVAYFLSPPGADRFDTPVPTILPTASACGTLAVAGFEGAGLWLYGIPERLDMSPDMGAVIERQNEHRSRMGISLTSATGVAEPLMAYSPSNSASDYPIEDDSLASKVDWRQSLFVKCKNIYGLVGETAARWIEHEDPNVQSSKRLVVVAPGGVNLDGDELGDERMPVDGSRMCLLDFDYVPTVLPDRTITIEVGEEEAELLTEHTGTMATEVAMERRRTIRAIPTAESSAPRLALGRSVTSISPPSMPLFEEGGREELRRGSVSSPSSPVEPPAGSQIYTAGSLQRSATATGFRHARYPPRPPLGSAHYASQSYEGHRYNHYGRPISEDSWETPPPPYIGGYSPVPIQHTSHNRMSLSRDYPRNSDRQPMQQAAFAMSNAARPNRTLVTERPSTSLDAAMSSRALPSGVSISQYEELAMAARSRGPSEASGDNATEASRNLSSSPDRGQHVDAAGRIRPATHHGAALNYWPGPLRSTTASPAILGGPDILHRKWHGPLRTMSVSPSSSVMISDAPVESSAAMGPLAVPIPPGFSLTGANLQNRLNHPVPPVPEIPKVLIPAPQHNTPDVLIPGRKPLPQSHQNNASSSMSYTQQTTISPRKNGPETQDPAITRNPNVIPRVPVPKPRTAPLADAWGVSGMYSRSTFTQATNMPAGAEPPRGDLRDSQAFNLASASAPNLLVQRPISTRLDTIDSVADSVGLNDNNPAPRSRAQSLTQPTVMPHAEPSAYFETTRTGQSAGPGKYGKKAKRRKEETAKKGTKCVVM